MRSYMLHDSNYMTFLKTLNYNNGEQSSCQELWVEGECDHKGLLAQGGFSCGETIPYSDYGGGYTNLYMC